MVIYIFHLETLQDACSFVSTNPNHQLSALQIPLDPGHVSNFITLGDVMLDPEMKLCTVHCTDFLGLADQHFIKAPLILASDTQAHRCWIKKQRPMLSIHAVSSYIISQCYRKFVLHLLFSDESLKVICEQTAIPFPGFSALKHLELGARDLRGSRPEPTTSARAGSRQLPQWEELQARNVHGSRPK